MASEAAGQSQKQRKSKSSSPLRARTWPSRIGSIRPFRGVNFEPLIDRSEIYAFEDSSARVQSLIAQADTIIFVLSPEAVASTVCAKEVAFAASLNKRFAPVVPPAGR